MKNYRQNDQYLKLNRFELIEQLKRAEQELLAKEQEVERLKNSFLSNISHEIRTPMNAIIGFSGLLKDEGLCAEERNFFIEGISSSSQQLLATIDNIIQAARIESNEIVPKEETFAINEFLEDLHTSYMHTKMFNGKKHLSLKLHTVKNKNPFIITDSIILRKILSNLIDNALKFTDNGSIEFGYSFINKSKLQLFVLDTGIGIPKDKFKIIFEKFRQVDDSYSKKHNGLGMGLSISQNLAQLLGGKMNIVSSPGLGTKVYISLPIKASAVKENSIQFETRAMKYPSWFNQLMDASKPDIVNSTDDHWQIIPDIQSFSA